MSENEKKRRDDEARYQKKQREEDERLAEKRDERKARQRRAKKRQRVFVTVFLIVLFAAILIVVSRTPLFEIRTVSVEGNECVATEDILSASGLSKGDNIFDRLSAKSEEAIRHLPYISTVSVKKKLPATVVIRVTEEREYAAVVFPERTVLIDRNGKTIRLAGEEPEAVPRILGCEEGAFAIGDALVLADEKQTETLMRCLDCIDEYDIENVTEIDLSDKNDISLRLSDALKIRIGALGNEDDLAYKMASIKETLGKLPQMLGVIDASNMEAGIFYRPTEESYLPEIPEGGEEEETAQEGTEETPAETTEGTPEETPETGGEETAQA